MLQIAGRKFSSRLIVGTGKFSSNSVMKEAINASGSEIVTVALRRVDLDNTQEDIIEAIDFSRIQILPNTSGAQNASEAIKIANIGRNMGLGNWVKLEVTPDPWYLLPDPIDTLKATEKLAKDGFAVLVYMNADPVLAKRLEDAGAAAVMPLASPIGSARGMKTKEMIRIIIENSNLPVVVDAGLGSPSDAGYAMEMGADAVLVNTAIATSDNPVKMAKAFKLAVEAGRTGYEAGIIASKEHAYASSPEKGII